MDKTEATERPGPQRFLGYALALHVTGTVVAAMAIVAAFAGGAGWSTVVVAAFCGFVLLVWRVKRTFLDDHVVASDGLGRRVVEGNLPWVREFERLLVAAGDATGRDGRRLLLLSRVWVYGGFALWGIFVVVVG